MNLRKFVSTALLFISPLILVSQDEVIQLIQKMEKTQGRIKVDLLNEISNNYRKTDRIKAMQYARLAYENASKNNYMSGKALAKKNEGICWFFIGGNDSAKICYSEALEIFTKIKDEKGVSACLNNLGLIAQETGKYDEALKYYQLSKNIDQKLNDEIGMALTLENMAAIYMYQGLVNKALILTTECIKIYTKKSYLPGLMTSYSNLGSEYDLLMRYDESIRENFKTLKIANHLKDNYWKIMANSNIGVVYWHMGKPDIAMKYLNFALAMNTENDDAYNLDNTLNTIAQIYTVKKKYNKANDILQYILKRNEKNENERLSASIMISIARNLIELNEIDKALGYLNKSLEITTRLSTPFELLENYRNLAHVEAILHNFKAADSLQDLFASTYLKIQNGDSLSNNRKENNVNIVPVNQSKSILINWIIAGFLFTTIFVLSVFM